MTLGLLACRESGDKAGDTGTSGGTDIGYTDTDSDTVTDTVDPRPVGPHGTLDADDAATLITGANPYAGAGAGVAFADADDDGDEDLLILADEALDPQAPPYISVFHEIPAGTASLLDAAHTVGNELPLADSRVVAIQAMDLTADGITDLLVSRTLPYEGAEAVVLAGPISDHRSLGDAVANTLFERDAPSAIWTAVPDVTGDDDADLIAGQPLTSDGAEGSGELWVFHGPLLGRRESDTAYANLHGNVDRELLGAAVAEADFDGDGIGDLAISATVEHVYVLSGPIVGDVTVQQAYSARYTYDPDDVVPTSIYASPVFGGDLNDDGSADLAFGSQDLRVIDGPIRGELDEGAVSSKLAGAGAFASADVDQDGVGDVLVGDGAYNPGVSADQGAAYLYYGPIQGAMEADDALFVTQASRDLLGAAVAIGDANADGWPDLAIGGPGLDQGGEGAGAVLFFYGGI